VSDAGFEDELGWRELSLEDREREYSPSSCVNYKLGPYLDEYASQSAASRSWCEDEGLAIETLQYGPNATHTVDIVGPPHDQSPLVVFIHGGYWQALSKFDGFGPAQDFVSQGRAFASVGYTLAPAASLGDIVNECRAALSHVARHAARLGCDPDRIFVAGSSAGAHLATMVALDPNLEWRPAGLVLLSGIYELEPLIGTTINDALGLDVGAARRNSPSLLPMVGPYRSVVTWGENETDQFKQQSRLFARRLDDAGSTPTMFEVSGRNHFDIVSDLGNTDSKLGQSVATLMDSGTHGTRSRVGPVTQKRSLTDPF